MSILDRSRPDHIKRELAKITPHKELHNSTMICCPYHNDKTPSMRVYHASGIAVCYGCKTKTTFDEMAPKIHLEPFKKDLLKPLRMHNKKIDVPKEPVTDDDDYLQDNNLDNYNLTNLPTGKKWRDISTNLLIDIGCQLATHKEYGTRYIYMPVYVRNSLVGYSLGRMKKIKGYTSYINAKGNWAYTKGLFPLDYSVRLMRKLNTRSIVLVEGQRDALRLLSNGIPAVCIFGTNNWCTKKDRELELSGINTIIALTDGDQAGIECLDLIDQKTKHCRLYKLRLWRMEGNPWPAYEKLLQSNPDAPKPPDLWDPCNAPQWVLDRIKSTYFSKRKNAKC